MKPCLFDTHAHLDDRRYDGDRSEVISSLPHEGVALVCNIGADLEGSRAAIALAQQYPFVYASVGVHPYDAEEMTEADLEELRQLAASPKVVALGEIGLDYHWEECRREEQKYWFSRQMELAGELDLPVIIHDRDAHADTLSVLRQFPKVKGIMHCYSGSAEMAKEVLELGYYISFSGTVTYKNARKVAEAALIVPDDRILIETDSPYLSPDGYRGKRNEPKRVEVTCRKLAELRGVSFEEMAALTMENGKRIYGIQ